LPARRCALLPLARGFRRKEGDLAMHLSTYEAKIVQECIENGITSFAEIGISLRVRRNFAAYAAIRQASGDTHLNQVFDPKYIKPKSGS
jgi:hypothetical protein